MSVAFLMDEHVPSAITEGLRLRGIDVLTAQEDGSDGQPDPVLLDRAGQLGRVLFTRDEDFLAIAATRQQAGTFFSGLVFAKQTAVSIGQCISDLEFLASCGDPPDFENRVYFLPLP